MVFVSADLEAHGVGELPCTNPVKSRDGTPMIKPRRTSLARDRVRHVGEPVAFVVAETYAEARDAAELIEFSVAPLPAVTDFMQAMEPDAPQLHEEAADNIALDWEYGDADAIEAMFASAAHVTRVRLRRRLAAATAGAGALRSPLSPRPSLASPAAAEEGWR